MNLESRQHGGWVALTKSKDSEEKNVPLALPVLPFGGASRIRFR